MRCANEPTLSRTITLPHIPTYIESCFPVDLSHFGAGQGDRKRKRSVRGSLRGGDESHFIYDPPLVASFWPEVLEIIGASDVFAKPGQGQLLKAYGVMPVHRGEYDRTLLQRIVSVIKAGNPLLIAPEGGRSHVPAMRRAFPGIAYIIEETGVPVVPVGLVGTTEDFWQRAIRGEKPQLEIRIGQSITLPPITEKGASRREARQRNADLVMQHLAGLLPEEYRGVYAETVILPAETRQ